MYLLDKAKADIRQVGQKLAQMEGRKQLLEQQRDEAIMQRLEAQRELDENDLVQILLQKTSDYARQKAKQRIEEIVSQVLNVVFGGTHKFIIEMVVRSNRPEADYYLDDSNTVTKLEPPDYDRGGGKIDVISMALKLAVGELTGIQGPLFLDEVGKHVSAEFSKNVAYFLKEYSQTFGRQIILITHNTHLAEVGDVSLQVKITNGKSEVKAV